MIHRDVSRKKKRGHERSLVECKRKQDGVKVAESRAATAEKWDATPFGGEESEDSMGGERSDGGVKKVK